LEDFVHEATISAYAPTKPPEQITIESEQLPIIEKVVSLQKIIIRKKGQENLSLR